MGLFCDIDLIKLVSAKHSQNVTELEEINPLSGHMHLLKHNPTWWGLKWKLGRNIFMAC